MSQKLVWYYGELDFADLGPTNEGQFINIQKIFKPSTQILTLNLPKTFLKYVNNTDNLVSHLYHTEIPFIRPYRPRIRNFNLTIIGTNDTNMNQFLDIICYYKFADKLTLEDLFLDDEVIAILRILFLGSISIRDCYILPILGTDLAKSIFRSRKYLNSITIENYDVGFQDTIDYILRNCAFLINLETLSIDMPITEETVTKLMMLSKSKSLKTLIIQELNTDIGEEKIEQIKNLLRNKLKIDVSIFPFYI